MKRPPLISSSVSAILATSAGLRKGRQQTSGPKSTREVTAARPVRMDQHSQEPSTLPSERNSKWSGAHSESNPASSAKRAICMISAQPRVLPDIIGSQIGRWRPTLSGRRWGWVAELANCGASAAIGWTLLWPTTLPGLLLP